MATFQSDGFIDVTLSNDANLESKYLNWLLKKKKISIFTQNSWDKLFITIPTRVDDNYLSTLTFKVQLII